MTLDAFFNPQSVAVIGASRDPKKVGHVIFRNFVESGFRGHVYPINPNAEEVFQKRAYASVRDVPHHVDLAVVCVPQPLVAHVLEECGMKGVRAVIVISAGFKETGNETAEKELAKIAKRHNIRLIGPNCLGVYDPYTGVDTFFLPRHRLGRPKPGNMAFISQSGAVASVVLDWMESKGYRASKFVSYGNAVDINENELIEYLAKDRQTEIICVYLEGAHDGRRLMEVAKKCKKPIVALKGGVTSDGTRAVASHTGSLAGAAEVYAAAFKQSGIVQAHDMVQIFDYARVLSSCPKPKGKRVQVITNGGGFGILTVDEIVANELEMAQPSKDTVKAIRKAAPPHVIVKNPIDLAGDATVETYRAALDAAIKDKNNDMLVVIALMQVPNLTDDIVDVLEEAYQTSKKPMVIVSAGGNYTELMKKTLDENGIPTFSYPDRAVTALRALWDYSKK
ncbi:MAG: CoA-binding protein [Candidatus Aenigmatarchaeota archaeon]|nr:MAG: CoA-binding protein [Candidatus Aenigmarchaeota archaeon]